MNMKRTCLVLVLSSLVPLAPVRAQDALQWFQKAAYTTDLNLQIRYYKEALRLDPGYAQAEHNLAGVYARKGLINHAIKIYETLIRQGKAYYQTYYDLACCYGR